MSDGLFLLLLAAVGFGVRQLALALPVPEAVVRRYLEQQRRLEVPPMQHVSADEDHGVFSRSSQFDNDDNWRTDDHWSSDDGVNIDGAPMIGDVDIHGNVFGVTDSW